MRLQLVFAALLLLAGCKTSQSDIISGGTSGGIGDDVCAVMLSIDLSVVDTGGRPVFQAELWEEVRGRLPVNRHRLLGKAYRLGLTDAEGRLSAPLCYMGSVEYAFWHPEETPVQVRLLVLREGYGAKRLQLNPPTSDVLSAGRRIQALPGDGGSVPLVFIPAPRERVYRLVTSVVLPVAQ